MLCASGNKSRCCSVSPVCWGLLGISCVCAALGAASSLVLAGIVQEWQIIKWSSCIPCTSILWGAWQAGPGGLEPKCSGQNCGGPHGNGRNIRSVGSVLPLTALQQTSRSDFRKADISFWKLKVLYAKFFCSERFEKFLIWTELFYIPSASSELLTVPLHWKYEHLLFFQVNWWRKRFLSILEISFNVSELCFVILYCQVSSIESACVRKRSGHCCRQRCTAKIFCNECQQLTLLHLYLGTQMWRLLSESEGRTAVPLQTGFEILFFLIPVFSHSF